MDKKLKQFYNEHSGRNAILSEEAAKRVKENIFSKLGTVAAEEVQVSLRVSLWEKMSKMFVHGYVLVPLVILLFISGTAYASADSLPGDTLYPIKRQVENAQILVAPNPDAKLKLQEKFAQKRLDELKQLQVQSKTSGDSEETVVETKDSDSNNDGKDNSNQPENKVENDNNNGSSAAADHRNNQNNRRKEARTKAANEANKALEDLQKTRKDWQDRGDNNRASQIDEKVKQLQRELDDSKQGELKQHIRSESHINTNLEQRLLKY